MIIEEHARLEVNLPDGRNFNITESDIVADSLSVASQCVNGNAFAFGCVSPAQLSVRFRISGDVSRYDMYGAEITLYRWFGATPPENGGKAGIFNVTSVNKQYDIFTVSASDNVIWLDSSAFDSSGETGEMGNIVYKKLGEGGSMWNALDAMGKIILELTDFAFHHDGLIKQNIPNGEPIFTGFGIPVENQGYYPVRNVLLSDDERSDNLRDYIAWLAEYMGGFVIADTDGNMQFKLFQTTYDTQPLILHETEFQMDSLEIAGFGIFLYSAKIVTEDNCFWSRYFAKDEGSSVINSEIVVQGNPFVEFIYNYNVGADLSPIPAALLYYQHLIPIRPFSGIYHGEQYLSLGQYICIIDDAENACDTVITNILWKFRGGQQIRCIGEDSRTLSQARKRTQAVRMGERMRTQISRLSDRVAALENRG